MEKEKSIYAGVLESAISWRVRDMYNLYGTIRRVLFEGRKAERAAMLSELIKMQGGNIGGSAKAPASSTSRSLEKERCSNQSFNLFAVSRQLSALVAETNAGSKRKMFLMTFAIWIGAEVFRTDIQRCAAVGTELSVRTNSGTATRTDRHL